MNDTSAGTPGKKSLAVFAIVERDGRTHWIRVGNAFANRDGSTTLYLDAVPIGTNRLQVREPRFDDGARGYPSAGSNGAGRGAHAAVAEGEEARP